MVRVSWAEDSPAKAQALADIEGEYAAVDAGCQAGHKSFISLDGARQKILWFSDAYQDWNFNEGSQARPVSVAIVREASACITQSLRPACRSLRQSACS